MTGRRVTPLLKCANDAGGQCAPGSSGDAHPSTAVSLDTAKTYVLAPRLAVAGRDARTVTGATPPLDAPVVAWARVCLRTPRPRRGRSRPWIPAGRQVARRRLELSSSRAPRCPARGSAPRLRRGDPHADRRGQRECQLDRPPRPPRALGEGPRRRKARPASHESAAGTSTARQAHPAHVSLASQPPRREFSTAQIVQSVIDRRG